MGYADGLVLFLTDKVEWSRFNPVAYLFAAAMLAPFIWIARKLYYRPAKLKAMQAKYGQWANTGNCSVNACSGCILPAVSHPSSS